MTDTTPNPPNPGNKPGASHSARFSSRPARKPDETAAQTSQRRRRVTLIIRAFVNEDGQHYGVVSDPGESAGWEATFSEMAELVNLVQTRLDQGAVAENDPAIPAPPQDDPTV